MNEPAPSATITSPLGDFLGALFTDGNVTVSPFSQAERRLPPDAEARWREWEENVRAELVEPAPVPDHAAATWAVLQFYHACQFFADRDPPEAIVRQVLAPTCPGPQAAETDYAVDLVFRFLPDLLVLAEQRAPGDALTAILREWARAWPLSSVGYSLVPIGEPAPAPESASAGRTAGAFLKHPALRRLYLDRIVARNAKDRVTDPRLRRQLAADLAPFPELSSVLVPSSPTPAIEASPPSLPPPMPSNPPSADPAPGSAPETPPSPLSTS